MSNSQTTQALAAIILCGGRSSRMGQPKALLKWRGKSLVEWLVEKIRPFASPIILVGAPGLPLPLLAGTMTVFDEQPFPGPVAAFGQGLKSLPASVNHVLLLSCDLPLFEPGLIEIMKGTIGNADFAMPLIGGVHQPLCALYQVTAVVKAMERLPAQGASMSQLRRALRGIELNEAVFSRVDPSLGSFRECNTPEEFALLGNGQFP